MEAGTGVLTTRTPQQHAPRPSFARTAPLFVLSILLLQCTPPASALAADGQLDPTFGRDGKVTTSFTAGASASAVAVQSDGRIVAAGGAGDDFALARYDTEGALDTTFGTGGRVTTGFTNGAFANAVAIQSDGRIVAAGVAGDAFALARYDTEGALDTTFGTDGIVTTNLTSGYDQANGVAIQADGKIVAAGLATPGSPWRPHFALARYRPDGTLDTSFGDGGTVDTTFGVRGVARAIVLQPDQKIVLAGTNGGGFALARYDSDGTLDASFGNGGKVATALSAGGSAYAVALQPDGRIVAAGSYDFYWFALARFRVHGGLDRTFGGDGFVTTDVGQGGEQWVSGLVIRSNGKVVAAGGEGPHEGGEAAPRFVLTRYRANGVLDPMFGGDGDIITRFKNGAAAGGVTTQSDGKIVVVGTSAGESFALARYVV
jgi:uncharacterized delta-60 repeat protein